MYPYVLELDMVCVKEELSESQLRNERDCWAVVSPLKSGSVFVILALRKETIVRVDIWIPSTIFVCIPSLYLGAHVPKTYGSRFVYLCVYNSDFLKDAEK